MTFSSKGGYTMIDAATIICESIDREIRSLKALHPVSPATLAKVEGSMATSEYIKNHFIRGKITKSL